MKVGIVTITELDNFGNRLQNYALQEVLKGLGHTVETIPNLIIYKKRKNPLYKILKRIIGSLKWLLLKNRDIISGLEKQERFSRFDSQFFRFSTKRSTIYHIPRNLDNDYDAFVAGSDQIWNSYFLFNFEFNFLRFAQDYKRVSYAASFGTDQVKEEYVEQFTHYLSEMNHISVREITGKKIVESLTNKTATVVLDPTMLRSASQWSKMEKKPDWAINENYILTYYLGKTECRKAIFDQLYNENSEFKSYRVIDISDPNLPEQYTITPDEFLWLIHHAALVVTDSFHGTVFSILFGTPFCSSTRMDDGVSMQSRFESLFELLGIEREGLITDVKEQPGVYAKLAEYSRTSVAYLKDALNDVEKASHKACSCTER